MTKKKIDLLNTKILTTISFIGIWIILNQIVNLKNERLVLSSSYGVFTIEIKIKDENLTLFFGFRGFRVELKYYKAKYSSCSQLLCFLPFKELR